MACTTNVPVTGVTVEPTTLSLHTGGTAQIAATVVPGDATNRSVTWASSTTTVATVDEDGNVTAIAAGAADVTAATVDGSKTATCAVTVVARVEAPVFTPEAGSLPDVSGVDVVVRLSSATDGASLFYTMEGSTPTDSSLAYTADGITLTSTATLQAVAVKTGMTDSEIATGDFTLVPPSGYTLAGQIVCGSEPVCDRTSAYPLWHLLEKTDTGVAEVPDASFHYTIGTGDYAVTGLPDTTNEKDIFLSFRNDTLQNRLPGNYNVDCYVYPVDTADPLAYSLQAVPVMHVSSPYDNSLVQGGSDERPVHSSPVAVEWDAVSGADHYFYHVDEHTASGNVLVVSADTTDTGCSLEQSSSVPDQYYVLFLNAQTADHTVMARLETTYSTTYGLSYTFTIE